MALKISKPARDGFVKLVSDIYPTAVPILEEGQSGEL